MYWHGGVIVGLQTCSEEVAGSTAGHFTLSNDFGQVVHPRAFITKYCDLVVSKTAVMPCICGGNYGSGITLAIRRHRLSGELTYGSLV